MTKTYMLTINDSGSPSIHDLSSPEGIAALVLGLTGQKAEPKEPAQEHFVTYVKGKGINVNCPFCNRHTEIGASSIIEDKRPYAMNLPCGCKQIGIRYMGFDEPEKEEPIGETTDDGGMDDLVREVGQEQPRRKTKAK